MSFNALHLKKKEKKITDSDHGHIVSWDLKDLQLQKLMKLYTKVRLSFNSDDNFIIEQLMIWGCSFTIFLSHTINLSHFSIRGNV